VILAVPSPLVQQYIRLCMEEGIEIAGIEFVEDARGNRYTYDINGTTNYNQALGAMMGVDGMRAVARYVRRVAVGERRAQRVRPARRARRLRRVPSAFADDHG